MPLEVIRCDCKAVMSEVNSKTFKCHKCGLEKKYSEPPLVKKEEHHYSGSVDYKHSGALNHDHSGTINVNHDIPISIDVSHLGRDSNSFDKNERFTCGNCFRSFNKNTTPYSNCGSAKDCPHLICNECWKMYNPEDALSYSYRMCAVCSDELSKDSDGEYISETVYSFRVFIFCLVIGLIGWFFLVR